VIFNGDISDFNNEDRAALLVRLFDNAKTSINTLRAVKQKTKESPQSPLDSGILAFNQQGLFEFNKTDALKLLAQTKGVIDKIGDVNIGIDFSGNTIDVSAYDNFHVSSDAYPSLPSGLFSITKPAAELIELHRLQKSIESRLETLLQQKCELNFQSAFVLSIDGLTLSSEIKKIQDTRKWFTQAGIQARLLVKEDSISLVIDTLSLLSSSDSMNSVSVLTALNAKINTLLLPDIDKSRTCCTIS
jgi:hypothetical protein